MHRGTDKYFLRRFALRVSASRSVEILGPEQKSCAGSVKRSAASLMHILLAKLECEVDDAINGIEALKAFEKREYDLVLMEWSRTGRIRRPQGPPAKAMQRPMKFENT
jgi:hypothetical protein